MTAIIAIIAASDKSPRNGSCSTSSGASPHTQALKPGSGLVAQDLISTDDGLFGVDQRLNNHANLYIAVARVGKIGESIHRDPDRNARCLRLVHHRCPHLAHIRILIIHDLAPGLECSNHAFGLHELGTRLRLDSPYRADCFYGLSKIWGEEFGRMYWTKHGIETVALRIGTFMNLPPRNERELASWLVTEDLQQLVRLAVEAPIPGFAPGWGISANTRAWYDLSEPNAIGYVPRQNAEDFASSLPVESASGADPVESRYQGGKFVTRSWTPEAQRRSITR